MSEEAPTRLERFDSARRAPNVEEGCEECKSEEEEAGGAQAGQPGLARSPLFTHTGDGDTIRPGHVANDYNPPVPPQAGPALRPDGDDVTPDPGL